jgi:hypothetical protein
VLTKVSRKFEDISEFIVKNQAISTHISWSSLAWIYIRCNCKIEDDKNYGR